MERSDGRGGAREAGDARCSGIWWRRHLDEQIALDDLLRLGNEALLQRLDLLDHLVRARVRPVELAPAVRIVGVLELLAQRLDLRPVL